MPVALTDTISFICSSCGHSADFPKVQEGKAIYCPKCQAAQVVKAPGDGTDRFTAERIPTGRIVKAEAALDTDRIAKPHGMAGTARIDFVCGACAHTSRISAALSGQPVRCPTCGTVQLAGMADLRVVRVDAQGKVPFICTACNYQARLSADYSGKAIRCPKCQGAQVVPRILRDPSGMPPALPSGAAVVRSESGTGSVAMEMAAPRSEPSPALRTPAAGTVVAQPLSMPTPLPGILATPPPGSLRTPLPEPTSSASSLGLPVVAADNTELDLGELSAGSAVAAAASTSSTRGSVVRRSGRSISPQPAPRPQPGTEPTLEAAHAVRPEPEPVQRPSPAAQAIAQSKAEAVAPPAAQVVGSRPARLLPVLTIAAAVAVVLVIVLALMLGSANGRADDLQQQLTAALKHLEASRTEVGDLQQKLVDAKASTQLVVTDRDEQSSALAALRLEHDQLKAEAELLKAAAAVVPAKPSVPATGQPNGK